MPLLCRQAEGKGEGQEELGCRGSVASGVACSERQHRTLQVGLAEDSAEAALAALLAGPYAKSDEEWAGEIESQCAAVGPLDTVLEVGIIQDGLCEHLVVCYQYHAGMCFQIWEAAMGLLNTSLEVDIGWLCQQKGTM